MSTGQVMTGERWLTFSVGGVPAPQGSKSARSICGQEAQPCRNCRKRHIVKVNLVETAKGVHQWRAAVLAAARCATLAVAWGTWEPLEGPLILTAEFTLPRPKSHYRTGRNAGLLASSAPPYPASVPDLSKLVRATEDAMTNAGVWLDDAQVTDIRTVKRYADDQRRPGAVITVAQIPMA